WAITGEAGVFLDPFYSPGSDFIAISNGYVCDLIERERAGEPIAQRVDLYQQLYFSFYRSTLTLYQDQYPLFGDAQVMPLKVIWDYTYYWGVLAPLYISGRAAHLPVLARLREVFTHADGLNASMQAMLRAWGQHNAALDDGVAGPLDGRDLDQFKLDWFRRINQSIITEVDDDAFVAQLKGNVSLIARLAAELSANARAVHPSMDDHGLSTLLPLPDDDAGEPLLPAHWYGAAETVAA